MKRKSLEKRIQRLEKRLREGPKKLAKLKRKLQAKIAAEAKEAGRKSRAHRRRMQASEARKGAEGANKPAPRVKRTLNLSPERRAQLAEAMKARWAAKRAIQANQTASPVDQAAIPEQVPEPASASKDATAF
jgi:hypothetical protein